MNHNHSENITPYNIGFEWTIQCFHIHLIFWLFRRFEIAFFLDQFIAIRRLMNGSLFERSLVDGHCVSGHFFYVFRYLRKGAWEKNEEKWEKRVCWQNKTTKWKKPLFSVVTWTTNRTYEKRRTLVKQQKTRNNRKKNI